MRFNYLKHLLCVDDVCPVWMRFNYLKHLLCVDDVCPVWMRFYYLKQLLCVDDVLICLPCVDEIQLSETFAVCG